jgi:hypothetical protein
MRRLERGAGRRRGVEMRSFNPAANAGNRGGWGGARARGSQPRTRAASGHALGVLRPLCEELADGPVHHGTRKRGPKPKHRRKAMPRAAAERREARRPTLLAGDLRRSGDRPDRKAGHRVRRFRTSACRRSAPLIFFQGAENRRGAPAPCQPGRRSFGCLTIESE